MSVCIHKITVEHGAGGELEDLFALLVDLAERYEVDVECKVNGLLMVVKRSRAEELHARYLELLRAPHSREEG